jgi:hypothetical protein
MTPQTQQEQAEELVKQWAQVRESTNDAGELEDIEDKFNALFDSEPLWTLEEIYQASLFYSETEKLKEHIEKL